MKFFVIGLGSIGKRHARNLIALDHTVWGYDKSLEVALQAKEQIPGLEIAADFFDCDACIICTPPDQHIAEIMNAIEAGEHIFVEKPIGVPQDIELLEKLLEEAKRKNLVVMVGNMLRFHPEVRRIRLLIKNPDTALFEVLQKNERYTEPVILNWGAHEIDLALHFLGPAKVNSAYEGSKRASVILDHEQGTKSLIKMDYLTEPEVRRFKIVGKSIALECDLRLPDWNDVYMDEMRCFIADISEQSTPADWWPASGEQGLATLKIIAEALKLAR